MEFKFRDVDNRPPNSISSPSLSSFNSFSGQGFRPIPNFIRPDPLMWELEKAQIREEIIASEIARRRALEAEVRWVLMAEWEMEARHRARQTGLYFEEHRLIMRLDPGLSFMPHFNNNDHHWRPDPPPTLLPLHPQPSVFPPSVTEVLNSEVKDTSVGNKNKLIILAKPDPNHVIGAKRKIPPPAGSGVLPMPLISLKQKPNEEWSCAICRVSATSKKGFIEHIEGRKHKAKEAKLKVQTMEKISNATTLPKKPRHISEHVKIPVDTTRSLGSETEAEEKLPQLSKNVDVSNQKIENKEKLQDNKDELLMKKEKKAKWLRKKLDNLEKPGATAVDKVESTSKLGKEKKYKFWCETCLVGTHSLVVMESHMKGRKHVARLRELDKNNAAAPAITTTNIVTEQARSNGSQMPKVTDGVVNEAALLQRPPTVTEQARTDGSQMPKVTDGVVNAAAPTTNTVTELARSDGSQMPKVTDGVANKANEKVMDVQEADSSNLSPVIN